MIQKEINHPQSGACDFLGLKLDIKIEVVAVTTHGAGSFGCVG